VRSVLSNFRQERRQLRTEEIRSFPRCTDGIVVKKVASPDRARIQLWHARETRHKADRCSDFRYLYDFVFVWEYIAEIKATGGRLQETIAGAVVFCCEGRLSPWGLFPVPMNYEQSLLLAARTGWEIVRGTLKTKYVCTDCYARLPH
jgi:hypothetical protein